MRSSRRLVLVVLVANKAGRDPISLIWICLTTVEARVRFRIDYHAVCTTYCSNAGYGITIPRKRDTHTPLAGSRHAKRERLHSSTKEPRKIKTMRIRRSPGKIQLSSNLLTSGSGSGSGGNAREFNFSIGLEAPSWVRIGCRTSPELNYRSLSFMEDGFFFHCLCE
jgi:hypothetical protein